MYTRFLLFLSIFAFAQADRLVVRKLHGIKETGPVNPRAALPEWGTFPQKLDHYNPLDTRTWSMRYVSNDQFFQNGGPIFLFLGGEWTIDQETLMKGQIFDMASQHNGTMFYTEHRFYGESYPTDDYSVENLKYLTTEQALEDIATFITHQKSLERFKNSKVVVVGGSYSAMLATWIRLKYPHLVDIAYSSSAPIEAVVDFYEYLEVVNDVIKQQDEECLELIADGIEEIAETLLDPNGTVYISELFRLCDPDVDISADQERAYFFSNIVWTWAGIVQYATEGDVEKNCKVIKETEGTNTEKLLAFLEYNYGEYECMEGYYHYVEESHNTELTTDLVRQWEYQTCTEYGFYQSTSSPDQPFGDVLPIDYFVKSCEDVFELTSDVAEDGVDRTNILYGGKGVVATKVINVHGANDPWHRAGVVSSDIGVVSPTIVIEGASHCQDLSSADVENDSPQLYEAKLKIKAIIEEWLKEDKDEDPQDEDPQHEDPEDEDEDSGANALEISILTIATVVLLCKLM